MHLRDLPREADILEDKPRMPSSYESSRPRLPQTSDMRAERTSRAPRPLRTTGDGPDRKHLRAAGGAAKHPIGLAAHLGVAAFAGVPAQSVRQGDYLLQSQ